MKKPLISILAVLFISSMSMEQEDFEITIERKVSTASCTQGYMLINNKVICYTLELPWLDNSQNISCIPIGTYTGILRYDKSDKWRIQLDNVPNRSGVQIHMGNYTSQTKGCILVGLETDIENCRLIKSSNAYAELYKSFYGENRPNSTPNKKITLKII